MIDEAQHLMPDVLEQLRLLTNLETDDAKLLQIVLIGQPELQTTVTATVITTISAADHGPISPVTVRSE